MAFGGMDTPVNLPYRLSRSQLIQGCVCLIFYVSATNRRVGGIMFSGCPSVRPSVRPCVRPGVHPEKFVSTISLQVNGRNFNKLWSLVEAKR